MEKEGGTTDLGSLVIGKVAQTPLDFPVCPLVDVTGLGADGNIILSIMGGSNGVVR